LGRAEQIDLVDHRRPTFALFVRTYRHRLFSNVYKAEEIEMGLLVEGRWQDQWYASKDGSFQREQAQRRHWITADGSAGPSGESGFAAEAGRYHLYVSLACPWAHRTLILRKLKGLEELIDVSVVSYLMLENGWTFDRLMARRATSSTTSTSCTSATPPIRRTTPAVSPCPRCGINSSSASSTTNQRKSSACSTAPSMA
jgi:predicted RNA-binding Zn-ribbon protein involved in translation (DUF1610 family)